MDILRKLIHMSMGLFALSLRWLNPWQAMLCALLAFLHNLYIFPLYGRKKLEKEEEKKRGYTAIVSYPAVVFALIGISWLVVPYLDLIPCVAASSWAILAFGDSFGAIFGKVIKGPALPWNIKKTWSGLISFVFFGSLFAGFFFAFVNKIPLAEFIEDRIFLLSFPLASIIAGIVESLDGQFDDNLGFPFVALSVLLSSMYLFSPHPDTSYLFSLLAFGGSYILLLVILALNTILALTAYYKKWVSGWGFIFGLFVGFSVIISLGPKGFGILCMFYLFANFSTFYGKKIKESRGISENNQGTRGLESVFSKGLAPALLSWFSFEAFVVVLAFYAADTVATEFGKTSKQGTYSLLNFKKVQPGTIGAVSIKGTAMGILSIFIFLFISLINVKLFEIELPTYFALSTLVFIFFIFESLINELNAKYELTSKVVIHITLGFLIGIFVNSKILYVLIEVLS